MQLSASFSIVFKRIDTLLIKLFCLNSHYVEAAVGAPAEELMPEETPSG
jgi:hypothetical protein